VEAETLPCFSAVKQAYHDEGYLTDMPWDFFPYYQRRLKKLMGAKRFESLQRLQMKRMEMYQEGRLAEAPSEAEVYALLSSTAEYHAFISVQIAEIVATNSAAYAAALPYFAPSSRVLELGCYTGTLVRFVNREKPVSDIAGCDRDAKVIEAAKTLTPDGGPAFFPWDYQGSTTPNHPPANLLLSILSTQLGEMLEPEGEESGGDPRQHASYAAIKKGMRTVAANWTHVAQRGTHLICISRSGTAAAHLGLLDALSESGWNWLSDRAHFVKVNGGPHAPEQAFPLDVFEFTAATPSSLRVAAETVVAFREASLATLVTYW